jgi:hypothetical protein
LCVVVASVVKDEEVVEWSEVSALICTTEEMEKYLVPALISMMQTCLRGLVWTKSFPPSSEPSVGENSTMSLTKVCVS